MKVEGWLFLGCGVFFIGADIVYWYTSYDPTGTAALALAVGLALLTGFYLLFTGRRLPRRPEDDNEGEIVQGTGEIGFFTGYGKDGKLVTTKKRFQAVPGIGKRTAERIVVELREKVEVSRLGGSEVPIKVTRSDDPRAIAREGLLGLGYGAAEVDELLEGADGDSPEDLIADALRMARR